MPIRRGDGFRDQFKALPADVRRIGKKKIDLLAGDPSRPPHASLRLKRIKSTSDWWEISINMKYRIGLKQIDGVWVLLVAGDHEAVLGG